MIYDLCIWGGKGTKKKRFLQTIFTYVWLFAHFLVILHAKCKTMGRNALLLLMLWLTLSCSNNDHPSTNADPRYQSIDTVPMLIMQVQRCSRLYTSEYRIHKIVTHDDVLQLKGSLLKQDINIRMPLGERKIAIPMNATLKAYIDFSQFSEKNVERHGEKITLVLPDPKIMMTSSKIDQQAIKQYVGLTRTRFSDEEMSHYEQQGREAIINSSTDMGIVETARQSAARLLIPMMEQLGYKEENITIAFRKELNTHDLRSLFDRTTIEKR